MNSREDSIEGKKKRLIQYFKGLQSLGVGFSGGVDSTLLLAVAHQVLGDRVVAMTATSPTHPQKEMDNAAQMARELGVRHVFFESDEMSDTNFTSNGPERCYHCKKRMFGAMQSIAGEMNVATLAHGANHDDQSDHRPGQKAAEELGVVAPLSQAGFTKSEIRQLARSMGLSNWNRPSMACLATRVPYGVTIDENLLNKIHRAEMVVNQAGFSHCRVRHHGNLARIEIDLTEMEKMMDIKTCQTITEAIRAMGYKFVCMDMEGFESGKMNREL